MKSSHTLTQPLLSKHQASQAFQSKAEREVVRLPQVLWDIIFDYSDAKSAAILSLIPEPEQRLRSYLQNDEEKLRAITNLGLHRELNTLTHFLKQGVQEELEKKQNPPVRNSTFARVASWMGIGAASFGIYKFINYGLSKIRDLSTFISLRDNFFDLLKKCVPWQLFVNFYRNDECGQGIDPYTGQTIEGCFCIHRTFVSQCHFDDLCQNLTTQMMQCNNSLWTNFTSACLDVHANRNDALYGNVIIFAGGFIALLALCTGLVNHWELSRCDVYTEENIWSNHFKILILSEAIRQNKIFITLLQRNFPQNEFKTLTNKQVFERLQQRSKDLINDTSGLKSQAVADVNGERNIIPLMLFKPVRLAPQNPEHSHVIDLSQKFSIQ